MPDECPASQDEIAGISLVARRFIVSRAGGRNRPSEQRKTRLVDQYCSGQVYYRGR